MATGSVAAEEAVPKAVAKTFEILQKNWKGRVRVSAPGLCEKCKQNKTVRLD